MKLQIALDCDDTYTALKVLAEVYPYVDIAEIGTGLMICEGIQAIKDIKKEYPNLCVLSDIKIMDGGGPISKLVLEAGADIVTVLGASDDMTIKGVVSVAKKLGKEVFVDLINVKNVELRARQVDDLGVDFIGVHTSYDLRESVATPLDDLKTIKNVINHAKTSISGGIKLEMLNEIIKASPDVVISGSTIMNSSEKAKMAKKFYDLLH